MLEQVGYVSARSRVSTGPHEGLLTVLAPGRSGSRSFTPKEGNFASFVLDILLFAFLVVTLGATLSATVQNYWQRERHAPRWLTAVLTGVAGMVIGAILIAAIAQPAATPQALVQRPQEASQLYIWVLATFSSLLPRYPKARNSCW